MKHQQRFSSGRKVVLLALSAAALLWFIACALLEKPQPVAPLPDFTQYRDTGEMKQAFFNYLQPLVERQNAIIAEQRQDLLAIAERAASGRDLGTKQKRLIEQLSNQYRLPEGETKLQARLQTLLSRVDVIPLELALVQAAKESGWGRSRFAVSANNLFGQWCYEPGCGLVPARRGAGKQHQVQKFETIEDAIADYLLNLNTHPRYKPMRDIRAGLRKANADITGTRLADGLQHYSERRQAYVDELKAMIRQYRKLNPNETSS